MNNLREDLVTDYPAKETDLLFIKSAKEALQDFDKKHAQ
jgi:hypothetical protein